MEKHSMPALPDWPDRDVQTRFSPAAIPQPAPPPDTGPTVQWPTPRRSRRALLAGVLALAAFTGCSGLLNFATVQVNTEEAQALMKQVSPALQYDTQLEYAAERIAQWMTEEVTNLTTADGQLVRKVQLDPGTGNMNPGISVNEFISDSTNGSLYLSSNVKIALTMDNSGNPYYDPGRLYAPAAQDAVEALRSEAEGCSRMGAVFIEYSGGTYVVALFL